MTLLSLRRAAWAGGLYRLPNEKEGMVSYGLAEKDGMIYVLKFVKPVPVETMEGLLERIRE